ncbi:MAG: hypothetical protein COV75_07570 [Candidatus Omnitrophica bacterium CG11_big_fil_rev_8_21_14_0_20_63_9]|nr:MAG: hypothetical protein COV75_07570 [Candidatus Omnitrophica bacterium CG11_big_fil_rev_8_21_14_0_20_63_9]
MSQALADAYYRQYVESADTHWWFRGRERVLQSVVEPLVRVPAGALIVDVGSGPGGPTRALFPDGRILAVDVSALVLQAAQGPDHCAVGDATALPFRPASVRVVCAFDVLEHLEHHVEALQHWRQVLEPGGWLVLTVPAYAFLWSAHDESNRHYRRYDARTLRQLLAASGFTTVRLTYFNSLLLPGVALVRWGERLVRRPSARSSIPEPACELDCQLRFPRWIERCCEGALRAEARWLKHRSLPAGVSICAVARVSRAPASGRAV